MDRIAQYVFFKFFKSTLGFVLLLAFLGWMIQLLRTIDLVTAKGQSLFTMVGQSLLAVPEIIGIVLFICVALGITRSLTALRQSSELFPIHSSRGPTPLYKALLAFLIVGVCFDISLSHQLVPLSNQLAAKRSDEINADLIANASRPGSFTEVAPNLTLMIEGRDEEGNGLGFFLHDERDAERSQTFIAERSQLSQVEDRLFVRLQNGAIQYFTHETGQLSTLEFNTYQVSVRELAQTNLFAAVEPTSATVAALILAGKAPPSSVTLLHRRTASALYVLCLGLFAFALTAAPRTIRNKRLVSVDIIVLATGLVLKALGLVVQQVGGGSTGVLMIYLTPCLPLVPTALVLARNGFLTRLPKPLRGGVQ